MRDSGERRDNTDRVLFVAHWDWVLFHFRLPLALALKEAGREVVMVCPKGKYTSRIEGAGFRWVEWRVGRRSMNPFLEALAVWRLVGIYRRERPRLAQHFTIKPNLYGTLAARLTRTPVVFNMFSGLGYLFSDALAARTARLIAVPVLRFTSRPRNVWTVAQNSQDRDRLLDAKVGAASRFLVVGGTGVDTELFLPSPAERSGPPVVLLACRLIEEKGVRSWVNAASELKDSGVDARFQLAGEPDEGNPSSIPLEHVRAWESRGVIEYLGHRDDMADLLRQADIAVLPTYYAEGVPRFLLEAAACGLPLIATDTAGCDTVVKEGWNGYHVPPHDDVALADAMRRLLEGPGIRREFGARSRELAVNEFDQDMLTAAYVDGYEAADRELTAG